MNQPALVWLCCGTAAQITALQAQAGPCLAAALGLSLAPPLHHPGELSQLPPASLVPLPLDPGLPLAGGGHWAEALGAWRQSCLLLLAAEQLQSGLPAAATALLQQWQVPLLGLVQWDAPWQAGDRRCDGLPWLGWLAAGAHDDAGEHDDGSGALLRLAVQLRLQGLEGHSGAAAAPLSSSRSPG
jgi:hypothetical protein